MSNFVHLHNHSDYSLLDGAVSVKKMVEKAKNLGMSHVALTDHGNMFGTIKFYNTCKANNIIPIIGSEFYVAADSRFKKKEEDQKNKTHHMVLLASDETGYRNLLKLSSAGYTEGFYYKPRIDDELLQKHSKGLIALSACLAGEIPYHISSNMPEKAMARAGFYSELFGKERFYLEIQDHGIPQQKTVNKGLIELSKKTGIPLVATNDVHFLNKDDAVAQDILICIGTNKKLDEEGRLKFGSSEFYFKSYDEMSLLFPDHPQALSNTLKIAEMTNLSIPLPGPIFPEYKVPEGFTLSSYFRKLAEDGLKERYHQITPELQQRLDYEINTIEKMNFVGYFLIVWDFIHYARQNNIPVGPGRGSGAGSIVAYSLKITDVEPLKYNLLFERFLNPDRVSMPDFDIDFCFERRNEVIDYVNHKYGADRVGQIITFGSLKAKAVIRDVARVLDLPYAEADHIAKLIPNGPKTTLKDALDEVPELKELAAKGQKHKLLIETSMKLEGLNRHASTHAAGIVIGREELTHYVPLYRDSKTGSISTQYTMDYLEDAGLVKMDFLGLKTLTLIKNTVDLLLKKGITLDISKIPENDLATFKLLGEGKSTCIFQFESQGMQNILKRAKPERIEDLIALNALYRPGPMENIDQFVEGKFNPAKVKYPLPELEPILKETYGVIVYQEQVMEIARKVGGYSLGQADILRRAMGKKKVEEMAKQRAKFIEGAAVKGYKEKVAAEIFDLLVPFAGYGFNKSHAAAYSVLAYQTAWLKANYSPEFMAANLTNEINNTDKLTEYIAEAYSMGISINPPDINLSEEVFTVIDNYVVYGLNGIKNVGGAAASEIIRERNANGLFNDIMDFMERVDLRIINKKVMEALIQSGVFNSFKVNRATLFTNLDKIMEVAASRREQKNIGQASLFDGLEEADSGFTEIQIITVDEYPKKMLLEMEKQNLGFFFSGHPLDDYKDVIKANTTIDIRNMDNARKETVYMVAGMLRDVKVILTKKNKKMAFAVLDNFEGSIEIVIFTDLFEKNENEIQPDKIVAVKGKVDKERGTPKIIADEILLDFSKLPKKPPKQKQINAVHIRLDTGTYDEENLLKLRDFCVSQKGDCSLYLHPHGSSGKKLVIKAGSDLTVSADRNFINKLYEYPQVAKVWTE